MKIYYLYKIIFLCGSPEGRYYLGKRAYSGSNANEDSYAGSGAFPKMYYKYYGKKLNITYIKEILEYNETAKDNGLREKEIIGDLWKTDPLCMNRIAGGLGGEKFVEGSKIIQYDICGNEIARYNSQTDAYSETGILNTAISQCCLKKQSNAGGFIWRFDVDPLTESELNNLNFHSKPIKQYSMSGDFIKEWRSAKEASDSLKINEDSLSIVLNHKDKNRHSVGGFIWCYYNEEPTFNKKVNFIGKRKVFQYTKQEHEFIQEFESLKTAADAVRGHWQHIQKCCNGIKPSAYGYYWEFVNVDGWNW